MGKTYAVATEFSVVDRASRILDKINSSGNRMTRALSGQMRAAEARFQAFGVTAQKAVIGAFGAVTAAAGAAIRQAIPLGMELEQNLGGTEAVFAKYASNVQKLAENAYKNMGLSASDYMATANKMGSLFQGSGLSQVRAMELTTEAMQRAADVASVMGIDTKFAMESIAGAAKGNFTMMDNLGVAMNATTLEAYALDKGMNFKWKTATNAQKAELAMKMFFERTAQYAGNFAKEADSTLSGSFGRMKTSVQDILANMALGRSIDVPLQNMQASVVAFTRNIVPTIVNIINKLPEIIKGVMNQVGPIIEEALNKINTDTFFGKILVNGLKFIEMLWKIREPLLVIGATMIVWRVLMDAIFVATTAMKIFGIVSGFVKGIMIAQRAAAVGTAIAIKGTAASSLAAAAGMKAYAIGAKIAAAAQAVFNAIMSVNPVVLVITAIIALIGIILVLTNKWKKVTDAVDGFFKKIHDMKGIGGVILNFLVAPFEMVWKVVRSVFDIFAAFKAGGFINGLKMIGLAILQFLVTPLQGVLETLSFLPFIGEINDKMKNWFETTRASLLAGGTTESEEEEDSAKSEAATAAPTRTAAMASSYSREENFTTNRVEIGLDEGLSVKNGAMEAPAFTLYTGRR